MSDTDKQSYWSKLINVDEYWHLLILIVKRKTYEIYKNLNNINIS